MSDVKWIKIVTNIFDDDAFQIIDAMPEADAIELIWFKLLVLAGKQNNKGLFLFKDTMPYTDEMLASVFHRPLNIVRLAMQTFIEMQMVEVINDVYAIPNWDKYQNTDRLEQMQENHRKRQERYRNKKKLELEEKRDATSDVTSDVICSYSISNSNISNSLSNSNKDILDTTNISNKDNTNNIYIKEIIDYLNSILGTSYTYRNKATNKLINARLNDGFSVEDFKKVIDKKYADWKDDEKMAKHLVPSTLFAPSHFENYLNQKSVAPKGSMQQTLDVLDRWLAKGSDDGEE